MSFFTREQRYNMLRGKRGLVKISNPILSADEEQFIQDFAQEKLFEILKDPEVMAIFERMKNNDGVQ